MLTGILTCRQAATIRALSLKASLIIVIAPFSRSRIGLKASEVALSLKASLVFT